jgi:hypothetical protein
MRCAHLTGVEHWQDVGVIQSGGGVNLSQEALGAERGSQLGVQHFERDEAIVLEVPGEVYRRHPAAPELTLEYVTIAQGIGQRTWQCSQATESDVEPPEMYSLPSIVPTPFVPQPSKVAVFLVQLSVVAS